jgi:hypothetical protein
MNPAPRFPCLLAAALLGVFVPHPVLASPGSAIESLLAVGPEGAGNEAASGAWKELVDSGPASLPAILEASGKASPVAANWLRLAAAALVERAKTAGTPVPLDSLEAALSQPTLPGSQRVLAFDLLQLADPARAKAIEPGLADDPVQELRRGAVQRLIETAKTLEGDSAKTAYLKALQSARDEDQTQAVAEALEKLGSPVDLQKHFGFLTRWHVVGPFENSERRGFETVFPPEEKIDLNAAYPGKTGEIRWQPFSSQDPRGKVDLNKPLGLLKEATAYATTLFHSETDRPAELRLGCKNAWKVWLNGKLLFSRDEYHRGQQMDQYKLPCTLRKGANTLLIKCCQNEQKETWTVEWEFQLRVCDSAGTAILSTQN